MSFLSQNGSNEEIRFNVIPEAEENAKLQMKFNSFCKHLSKVLIFLYVILGTWVAGIIFGICNHKLNSATEKELINLSQFSAIFIIILLITISLRSIKKEHKPFTNCLIICTRIIGIFLTAISFISPAIIAIVFRHGYDWMWYIFVLGAVILLISRIFYFGLNLQFTDELTI